MTKSTKIWVTFQKEGLHKYPAAANDPKLATGEWDDVSFLGYIHRHIFKFKVWIEVFHDDRDVEFIQFKRWLERLYADNVLALDFKSCEMISDDLHAAIIAEYPDREIWIDVSEDGENGAYTEYENPAVTRANEETAEKFRAMSEELKQTKFDFTVDDY